MCTGGRGGGSPLGRCSSRASGKQSAECALLLGCLATTTTRTGAYRSLECCSGGGDHLGPHTTC